MLNVQGYGKARKLFNGPAMLGGAIKDSSLVHFLALAERRKKNRAETGPVRSVKTASGVCSVG
jgi:hypothetical protein